MRILTFSGKRFNFPGSVSNTKRLLVTPGRSLVVLFLLSLILLCCTVQINAQVNVFGPEKYGSGDHTSTPSTKTFKVVDPSGSFDLILETEAATNQRTELIKAIVKLNGIEVVGVDDSDQTRIVKRVKLKPENVISVESTSVLVLTISPSPILTLNTNPNEPLFLRQEFPDGRTFDYFGTRKANGEVTAITSASLRTREGETTTYRFDKQSRITEITHPNGLKYEFEWLSDSAAKVSLTSPDGQTRITAPVDFSKLQAVAKKGSNCRGCLGSAADYANYTRVRNNHAVGAQEICRTAFSAVNKACRYIGIGLGLPFAKELVCTALTGAIAATGYGVALLPYITGPGCTMVLNGVELVCGVIEAVNGLDEGAAATCSLISKVVTTIERFVIGPKRGSTLKSLTKDDGKKIPLILIHGIHGSDSLNEISYDSDYWRNFIARFKSNFALTNAFALYAYQYYSDAEGVQSIAASLGRYIDAKLPGRSYVLLAHSMGGLVAKSYMVDYSHTGSWSGKRGGDNTLLLITLATPHHGTPAANDADALRKYMRGEDWYDFFRTANYVYWLKAAGLQSPTRYTSRAYNRSDLRWDSYDNAISTDLNAWLGRANSSFGAYTSKTIAYGGVLKDGVPLDGAKAGRQALLLPFRNDNRKLEFLNGTLVYGLGKRFGGTDGMVPYQSALLCANGPTPSSVSFSCSSPTRVRRFEPGTGVVNTPSGLTLSITRTARGYDHLDMLGHRDVLDWVVKDLLAIVPRPMVSTSLSLSPPNGSYKTGESISGTFTIANRGGANIVMNRVVIGGRLAGTCPNNQCPDFSPGPSSITLEPGQTVSYSGTFNPSRAGNYTFSVAYENSDGTWVMPVEPENNNRNQVNINVTSVLPNVVVSKSLTVTAGSGPFPLGQTVNGSFSITNRGRAPLTMRQVLIAGRVGDTCPNNVCPDFSPIKPTVTLNPGETCDYSGRITLTKAGTYTFYVAYQTPDEKWELPVKSENGNINKLSIVAQGPLPTLTGSSPDGIAASTTEQLLDLRGTRLRDILYCRLKAPNGTVTYIHGPLNQVIKVSDTQIRVKAKFLSRGTYIINAFTPEGRSNDFQIIVR